MVTGGHPRMVGEVGSGSREPAGCRQGPEPSDVGFQRLRPQDLNTCRVMGEV